MKKIIATVLAMVMALALCTTAFAAETKDTVDFKGYTLKDAASNATVEIADTAKMTITKTDAKVVKEGDKTTTYYYADKYEIEGQTAMYACDASIAECKLIDKAGKIVYLSKSSKLAGEITDVVTKMIEGKGDDAKGTDYVNDVYVIDGKAYAVGGDHVAMFNGLAVLYGAKADVKGYTLTKDDDTLADKAKLTYNAKGEVTGITAAEGDKTFEVVKKVPTSYTGDTKVLKVAKVNGGYDTYYILLGNTVTPSGSTSTTTKPSPKTFDAGIAMYVGMALTSVAGSAVVIGKKKEF